MDRRTLIGALKKRTNYTDQEVRKFLDALAIVVQNELMSGGNVLLKGIGRLIPHRAGPWKSRNPKSNKRIIVPAKWRVKFKPSAVLRDKVENSPKLYQEEDLLKRYGLEKEKQDGEVRSADRSEEGGERKARKRLPWL